MTRRKTLKNRNGGKKPVDMEKVYAQLDSGRSVKSVAEEWGVSPSASGKEAVREGEDKKMGRRN